MTMHSILQLDSCNSLEQGKGSYCFSCKLTEAPFVVEKWHRCALLWIISYSWHPCLRQCGFYCHKAQRQEIRGDSCTSQAVPVVPKLHVLATSHRAIWTWWMFKSLRAEQSKQTLSARDALAPVLKFKEKEKDKYRKHSMEMNNTAELNVKRETRARMTTVWSCHDL